MLTFRVFLRSRQSPKHWQHDHVPSDSWILAQTRGDAAHGGVVVGRAGIRVEANVEEVSPDVAIPDLDSSGS